MKSQTQLVIATAFAVAVGLFAGMYVMSPGGAVAIVSASPTVAAKAIVAEAKAAHPCALESASGPYEFTQDWLNTEHRLDAWNRYLKPLAGNPISYLEVGVFEGRSMLWMLKNVLTNPDSRATGIDIEIFPNYVRNLVRSGACEKVTNLKGPSQKILHTLPEKSFDLIYIDGSHLGRDVLVDAVLAFDRLKVGGLMVFDDYAWYTDWAPEIRPGPAIDAFITEYRHELEVVHKGYQMIVRRRPHPCAFNTSRYTPVGQYCYQWVSGALVRQSDRSAVALQPGERELIAEIAASPHFGDIAPTLDKFMARPEFQALNARLKMF